MSKNDATITRKKDDATVNGYSLSRIPAKKLALSWQRNAYYCEKWRDPVIIVAQNRIELAYLYYGTMDYKLQLLLGGQAALAEWLRRWTWNPMGSPRVGSNPAGSVPF